ncbi:hypothetical protein [Streptomyces sp. NPDC056713]|uniref:hypothetical protein n=1 Tax=Streptomyces sp. NPDC056713 TaxID=3345921 RepID=UPI0036938DF6
MKTIAAEAPKRKKSYHSRIEPTTLAAAVRRCGGAAVRRCRVRALIAACGPAS